MATLKLTHNEIPVTLGFQVCIIYKDELNPKITSMINGINFMPGMGLRKNQQGPSEFIEPKVPISKNGLGYQKIRKLRRSKDKIKKKILWHTFIEEGASYPYTGKPEPLMITKKLVLNFEIFAEEVNGIKKLMVEEPMVEELV